MSRAVHNVLLTAEGSDSSDFEEVAAFNLCVRKDKSFTPRINYLNLLDKDAS